MTVTRNFRRTARLVTVAMAIGWLTRAEAATGPGGVPPLSPAQTTATCAALAEITALAATSPLSKRDDARLTKAMAAAKQATGQRPAIPSLLVSQAFSASSNSHGTDGPGMNSLKIARGDGADAAHVVRQSCLESAGTSAEPR